MIYDKKEDPTAKRNEVIDLIVDDLPDETSQPVRKKIKIQSAMDKFVKIEKETVESAVAELVSIDGLSFHQIKQSRLIRKWMTKDGLSLPRSQETIRKYSATEADKVRSEMILEIKKLKSENKKFTTSVDEQTTTSNFRILNVQLYGFNLSFNLGMVRINIACPADKMVELTNSRLKKFSVDPEDVFATTTDAAEVCKKYGKILEIFHQLCYDHGIHLAIVKVIYKKIEEFRPPLRVEDSTSDEDDVEELNFEFGDTNKSFECGDTNKSSEYESDDDSEPHDVDDSYEFQPQIGELIKRVRDIVKLFKKSPKLNGILQSYVVSQIGHELQLTLDVRTRWNSVLSMLQSFSRTSEAIKKALADFNRLELWSQSFEEAFGEVLSILDCTKMTMNQISKDSATLLTAEGAFEFLFDELKRINSKLSLELLEKMKEEISKRRQKNIVNLLKFLQNPDSINEDKNSFFATGNKKDIIKTATEIWIKHFHHVPENQHINLVPEESSKLSTQERLQKSIEKRTANKPQNLNTQINDVEKYIKIACNNYAATKMMPSCLVLIYDALLLIKPTSIKNEQNFSMSANFLTKNRKRMAAKTLDDLCLLKSHFIQKSKKSLIE